MKNLLSIGRTGEPDSSLYYRQGRRIRSTCLSERKPVMARLRRKYSTKTGKGSKWMRSVERIPYLESLRQNAGVSDGAITCITRLQTVWKLNQNNVRVKDLYRLLKREELWIAAYKKLAHNKGVFVFGGVKGTIDGTSIKALRNLRDLVVSGNYTVGITRRVEIPKPERGLRSLGIPEFRDRLVQEVLRTLLECVYEPRFYESSHGFRPQRSQHTCLRQVRRDFGSTKWVLEGDISECFGTIDHNIVRKCLSRTIDDERFVSVIIQGLRSKVLMPKGVLEWMDIGTPQNGVCSPLLSNIVLHQLDRFLSRLKLKIDRGKQQRRGPEYIKLTNRNRYYKGTLTGKAAWRASPRIFPAPKRVLTDRRGKDLTHDPLFRRMHYTRYANHYIVGITGPRELAVRVKMLIIRFLKQRLRFQLNEEKIVITKFSKKGISFLGYLIRRNPPFALEHAQNFRSYTPCQQSQGKDKSTHRIRTSGITLFADVDKVIQNLAHKGFCKKNEPVPNFRYMHESQSYTIKQVNSILRRLDEYYMISENKKAAMSRFSYLVRYSIARMFAAKFKLRSVAHVFKRAGKGLGKPLKSKGKSTYGSSNEKLAYNAKAAKSMISESMPRLLYTKYKEIEEPDLKPLAKRWDPWKDVARGHIPWPIKR